MNAQTVEICDDPIAVMSRRRVPAVYVVDTTGHVVFHSAAQRGLPGDTRDVVLRLMASHSGDDAVLGLSGAGELLRLAPLEGTGSQHFALFLEPLAARSPVDVAAERFGLSDRECEVLRHILRGASTNEIATDLVIAESTVATHVRKIGSKMNATKRKEIVAAVLGGR